MTQPPRKLSGLVGPTIATMLLFPLVEALGSGARWLHWRTQDTLETAMCWALLAIVVQSTVWGAQAVGRDRLAHAAIAAWLCPGGFLLAGALAKVALWRSFAEQHGAWAVPMISSVALLAVAVGVMAPTARRWPMERLTVMLAPLTLVLIGQVGLAQWNHLNVRPDAVVAAQAPGVERAAGPLTVVLLFDELSPDFLYGSGAKNRAALPAVERLLAVSTIDVNAFLPGGATERSIPALFAAGATTPGFVATLAAHHRTLRVWGWHLDYCATLTVDAERCHATSLYNVRTLDPDFSVWHPLWNSINFLPGAEPFGSTKILVAVPYHRRTLAAAQAWLDKQIVDPASEVVYVHVNVPHVPFLESDGHFSRASDRYVVTMQRYAAQIGWVDAFVAHAVDTILAQGRWPQTRIVLMSDHNSRALTPTSAHEHVVWVEHSPGQLSQKVLTAPVSARALLRQVAQTS